MKFLNRLTRCYTLERAIKFSKSLRCYSSTGKLIDPSIGLTQEQALLQETAFNFALKELRPYHREWDEKNIFPVEAMRKAADLGFGGLYVDVEDGGSGLTRLEASIVLESLAQGCVSTAAYISIHNMVCWAISQYGNSEVKAKFLPDLVSMKRFASYCLTEPTAGSDAASIRTRADLTGSEYKVNGSKSFISGSYKENVFLMFLRTRPVETGVSGISCLLVDGIESSSGFIVGKEENKLGWHSHPARQLTFEDMKVPASNLLGKEGEGFKIAMNALNSGRLNIASCSLGGAQWAVEETLKYTMDRRQFNRRIWDFQNTQFKLAAMASRVYSSRQTLRATAKLFDEKSPLSPTAIAATKYMVTQDAHQIADECLQLLGGYGYLGDFPLSQIMRDCRAHRIIEGTNEVMKSIVAKSLQVQ